MRPPFPPLDPPARLLHVRCLRPGCGREAVFDARRLFASAPAPLAGLSRRFVCACGRRAAHLSYVSRRPRPANPCGWF